MKKRTKQALFAATLLAVGCVLVVIIAYLKTSTEPTEAPRDVRQAPKTGDRSRRDSKAPGRQRQVLSTTLDPAKPVERRVRESMHVGEAGANGPGSRDSRSDSASAGESDSANAGERSPSDRRLRNAAVGGTWHGPHSGCFWRWEAEDRLALFCRAHQLVRGTSGSAEIAELLLSGCFDVGRRRRDPMQGWRTPPLPTSLGCTLLVARIRSAGPTARAKILLRYNDRRERGLVRTMLHVEASQGARPTIRWDGGGRPALSQAPNSPGTRPPPGWSPRL